MPIRIKITDILQTTYVNKILQCMDKTDLIQYDNTAHNCHHRINIRMSHILSTFAKEYLRYNDEEQAIESR